MSSLNSMTEQLGPGHGACVALAICDQAAGVLDVLSGQ